MKTPKLRSPRLLPIVIFAVAALLVFKGIGILSGGGYVLTGPQTAQAADGDTASVDNAAPRTEPTMSDASPTLNDSSPTMASAVGNAPPASDGTTPPAKAGATAVANADPGIPSPTSANQSQAAPVAAAPCPPGGTVIPAGARPAAAPPANASGAPAAAAAVNCPAQPADAVAMTVDANGKKMPLADVGGDAPSADAILQRLAERRAQLDQREAALNMREAIVAAAEKQMDERADALKALEAQIAALSDQKKSMEDEQFSGIVKMYEAMKPQDAATIFDGLDMGVLLRVAKAMDPRKMSPILAKMASARAQELTVQIAADDPQVASASPAAPDPNALPQIVGH